MKARARVARAVLRHRWEDRFARKVWASENHGFPIDAYRPQVQVVAFRGRHGVMHRYEHRRLGRHLDAAHFWEPPAYGWRVRALPIPRYPQWQHLRVRGAR